MTLFGMIGGAAIAALFSSCLEAILYGVSRHDHRGRNAADLRRHRCGDLHSCQTSGER
jgi:hypothetical protein